MSDKRRRYLKRFDTEQLTRFKKYTEDDIAATQSEIKSAEGDDFEAACEKRNSLKDQAALIDQHIAAGTKEEEPGEQEQTPAQKRAAKAAEKAAAAQQAT